MSQTVHLEVFYPHPPHRVWQVLTDRRALTAWMMENDFEPKLGHKFQFYSHPLPGLQTTIQCEVVELEEPTRLVYTWQEAPTAEPSLVIWTLTAVAGGTQLRLKHHQYSYTTAVTTPNRSGLMHPRRNVSEAALKWPGIHPSQLNSASWSAEPFPNPAESEAPSWRSNWSSGSAFNTANGSTPAKLFQFQPFTWEYLLNQQLPKVLVQDESIRNEQLIV